MKFSSFPKNRPSFFELFAKDQMIHTGLPALHYFLSVLRKAYPNNSIVRICQKNSSTLFLILRLLVENSYLSKRGTSFSESFYNIERVFYSNNTPNLALNYYSKSFKHRVGALFFLVVLPHLESVAERYHLSIVKLNPGERSKFQSTFIKFYPLFNVVYSCQRFAFQFGYLFAQTPFWSLSNYLLGYHYQRPTRPLLRSRQYIKSLQFRKSLFNLLSSIRRSNIPSNYLSSFFRPFLTSQNPPRNMRRILQAFATFERENPTPVVSSTTFSRVSLILRSWLFVIENQYLNFFSFHIFFSFSIVVFKLLEWYYTRRVQQNPSTLINRQQGIENTLQIEQGRSELLGVDSITFATRSINPTLESTSNNSVPGTIGLTQNNPGLDHPSLRTRLFTLNELLSKDDPLVTTEKTIYTPPPSIPKILESVQKPIDPKKCFLCSSPHRNPSILIPSGFVFCYQCIQDYVQKKKKCPLTGLICRPQDVRVIFGSSD